MGTRYNQGDYVIDKRTGDIGGVETVHMPQSDSPNYVVQFMEQGNMSVKASRIKKADKKEVMDAIRANNNELAGRFNKGDRVEIIEPSMAAEKGTIRDASETASGMIHYEVHTDNHGVTHLTSTDLELEGYRQ